VQGVLAPVQFVVFLVSLALVLRYLATGEGFAGGDVSVVVKTLALYAIMITGSIWERVVFGQYLFAPAFFWEDVFSMLVLALHTAYLALAFGWLDPRTRCCSRWPRTRPTSSTPAVPAQAARWRGSSGPARPSGPGSGRADDARHP
jgi:hypothetical protein